MSTLLAPKWGEFWSKQNSPLGADDSDEFNMAFAAEQGLLLDTTNMARVLEFGFGDGSLLGPLGFDKVDRYLGVDISPNMLDAFARRHPDLEVQLGDHSFRCDEEFDLIFSSAVVQYMNQEGAREHLRNCLSMLAPGGRIVWAANPWARLRWGYARGDLAGTTRRSLPWAIAAHAKRRLLRDNMGYWHDTPFFSQLAEEFGLSYSFYGSLHYCYRFHSVFTRREA